MTIYHGYGCCSSITIDRIILEPGYRVSHRNIHIDYSFRINAFNTGLANVLLQISKKEPTGYTPVRTEKMRTNEHFDTEKIYPPGVYSMTLNCLGGNQQCHAQLEIIKAV